MLLPLADLVLLCPSQPVPAEWEFILKVLHLDSKLAAKDNKQWGLHFLWRTNTPLRCPGNLTGPFTPVSWDSKRRQAASALPKCPLVGTGSSAPSLKSIVLKNWHNAMGSREAQFMFTGRAFYLTDLGVGEMWNEPLRGFARV